MAEKEHDPSIKGFCKRRNLSRSTAYKEIRAGRLRIKKVGARTIITPEAEAEWLDSLPEKVGPPRGIALKKMTA